MDNIELKVQDRQVLGKRTRFLRKSGFVPAHLFGPGIESRSLQVEASILSKLMSTTGRTTMLNLVRDGNGSGEPVFLWNVQRHPVTDDVIHIDFFRPDLTKPIRSRVPVHMAGEAPARREAAVVVLSLSMIEVEALPGDIPKGIEADISVLEHINQHVLVRDLKLPPNVKVITPADQTVVRAAAPRKEEEVVKPAAAAAAGAPEAAAAGEAAAPTEGGEKAEAKKPEAAKAEAKKPEAKAEEARKK
jgi:large subunit ribosomal protein L25